MSAPDVIRRPLGPRLLGAGLLLALAALAVWVVVGSVRLAFAPTVRAGEPAPDFIAQTLDGDPVQLSALQGKVVLLDFWTTTCVGCVGSTPKHNRMAERFGARGLVVLGVNQDAGDVEKVRAYVRDRPMRYPTVVDDGSIAEAFGVRAFPTAILLDAEGRVRARHVGAVTEDRVLREIGYLLQTRDQGEPTAALTRP